MHVIDMAAVNENDYILSLDVGTTTLRAHIYDRNAEIVGKGALKIEKLHPEPGASEMDPEVLWQQVQSVIKAALLDAFLEATSLTCMGITVQRNTFINWDKDTGVPFHNFITWQDRRASDYVKQLNNSYRLWLLNKGGMLIHFFTRKNRFLAAAALSFASGQVSLRLKWQIDHNEKLRQRIAEDKVCFACLETWLLWKFTKGAVYTTEYSCASSTGMYDPYQMEWSTIVASLAKLPLHILPPIKESSGLFGDIHPDIFGTAIPITAVIADQQGATFGQCCFNPGDVKCTMGTGTFIDCNTGRKPHASVAGLYPLIGWKYKDEMAYIAEGTSMDTGTCLEWAKSIGLLENIPDTFRIASSVPDSGGVYFIPAFSGLQAPINDDKACTTLVGISQDTTKSHIIRAIIESLGFRFRMLHDTVKKESKRQLSSIIRCDGGVCNDDFLVQMVADLTGCTLDRPEHMDMTSLGAAFLAGLAVGVWKDKEQLKEIRKTQKIFEPKNPDAYKETMKEWKDAMARSMDWYDVADS